VSPRPRLSINGNDEYNGIENGKDIVAPPPPYRARQYAANHQSNGKSHGLPTPHGRKSRISPGTGGQAGCDDADSRGQAEGDGDAAEGPEHEELQAVLGKTDAESEHTLQTATDEVHRAATNDVGDGAEKQEGTTASQGIDRHRPGGRR
jgi:hypothetical protein